MLRLDNENDEFIGQTVENKLIDVILQNINDCDAVIFEDYDKGAITPTFINKIVQKAKENKIPVIVDPKKRNFNDYQEVSLFKPNLREVLDGLKITLPIHWQMDDIKAIITKIINTFNIDRVMVTLSEKGVLIGNKTNFEHYPAFVRNIFDVSGAGDTVTAVSALVLACHGDDKTTAWLSNLAGGLVCEKSGVAPILLEELENEVIRLSKI
jgi:rfaE bifunctional protein kinase chain/domain